MKNIIKERNRVEIYNSLNVASQATYLVDEDFNLTLDAECGIVEASTLRFVERTL